MRYVLSTFVAFGLVSAVAFSASNGQLPSASQKRHQAAMESVSPLVEPGAAVEAIVYYTRIQSRLNFNLLDAVGTPAATLDQLIDYFGFAGLTADDLEKLESAELMPRSQADYLALSKKVAQSAVFLGNLTLESFQSERVLVSRFFAPKIVDYSGAPPYVPGWRKLVRLTALPKSRADVNGLATVYILFNYVKADVNADPFEQNRSKNNQVIIVPRTFVAGKEDSTYFMVYLEGPTYQLGLALEGVAFDLPVLKNEAYFVPSACAQCHGHDAFGGDRGPKPKDGIYRFARLNYLDTDQWTDAMRLDFPELLKTKNGVVFDGGVDHTTPAFVAAFSVVRSLNDGIQKQNALVDPSDFKAKAVEKWLELHAKSEAPAPQDARSFGSQLWNSAPGSDDQQLLTLLSRYCFRCHSSIRYNVFDKEGVANSSGGIPARMRLDPTNRRYMPNGRILPIAERDRLIELVERLFP